MTTTAIDSLATRIAADHRRAHSGDRWQAAWWAPLLFEAARLLITTLARECDGPSPNRARRQAVLIRNRRWWHLRQQRAYGQLLGRAELALIASGAAFDAEDTANLADSLVDEIARSDDELLRSLRREAR